MATIQIDHLIPTTGAAPAEGYDPTSSLGFTQWELGDEARFALTVPQTYVAGTDFVLRIEESTSSTSHRHGWRVGTTLARPGLHATDEQVLSETFIAEYVAAASSDQLTSRTFPVTGGSAAGQVSGTAIEPGDLISWVLTRVAATSAEDPNPVKVFGLVLEARVDQTAVSACPGRVGRIIDTVRDLFNDAGGGFLSDAFILRAMNRCLADLGQENYWRTEGWIPCSSGVHRIDLLAELPEYQAIHQVAFSGSAQPMAPLASYQQFDELRRPSTATGTPQYFVVQNNTLLVWPPPSRSLQSGFCVYHSYLPGDLTCSSENPDPPIPRAHDMLFVYFVLQQAFLRDRHAPGADLKFQEYARLHELEKQKLLGEGDKRGLALRAGR